MVAGVSAAFVFVEVWGSISGTAGWRKGLSHKFQGVSAIGNSLSAQMSTRLCSWSPMEDSVSGSTK